MTQEQSSYALLLLVIFILAIMPDSWGYYIPFAVTVGWIICWLYGMYTQREQDRLDKEEQDRRWEEYKKILEREKRQAGK